MKILTAATLAAVTVAALAGCAVPAEGEAKADRPAAHSAPDKPDTDPGETVFLVALRDEYPVYRGVDDRTLLGAARVVCRGLDRGETWLELVAALNAELDDARMSGFFIGASVSALCPEHERDLP